MSRGFCSSRTDPGQGAGRGSRPPSWYPGTCNWLVDFWSFSVGFPSKQPGINWADQAFDHFDPRKKVLSGGTTSPLVELTWPGELLEMYMIIHDMFFLSMAHCCKSQVVVFPESIRNPPSAGLMFEHGKTPRFPRFPGKIAQPNPTKPSQWLLHEVLVCHHWHLQSDHGGASVKPFLDQRRAESLFWEAMYVWFHR